MTVALLALLGALMSQPQGLPPAAMAPRPRNPAYVLRIPLQPARREVGLPKIEGPEDSSRPLVVIDAGHGGFDPGAKGGEGEEEKSLTLGLARALRDELVARARVRVALTRGDDRFLALDERSGIARRLGADLFVSIHADAADTPDAKGATVYTLSEQASDADAARIAARENRADLVNGVMLSGKEDAVTSILVDLSRREMLERSATFARLVVREASTELRFKPQARKGAGFTVLRSPDVPSVLFEAGYVSNPADATRLASPEGRARFAQAMARAIEAYFARVPPER